MKTTDTQKHRPDPFFRNDHAICAKCDTRLEPTGRGTGWRHVDDRYNPGK